MNKKIFFLSHGGGPLPVLGEKSHKELVENLERIAQEIRKPSAILVISAHWEENEATVTSAINPDLIYDYYGFPQESYSIKYPCPGNPELAKQVWQKLKDLDIQSELDEQRGFDHGLFIPLKIMFPEADIPCVQLSLLNNLNPQQHIAIGKALSSIEYENLLIIGSGFSFHNMAAFFAKETEETKDKNNQFEGWLIDTCSNHNINETERENRLSNWSSAPHARYCHPREEHLLPLHVCYGFAQRACDLYYELHILNKKASMYLWK
ncbi:MAG: class III extradiol ring-cleavage dioxygenase [Gammaproteobacteria bacterium]